MNFDEILKHFFGAEGIFNDTSLSNGAEIWRTHDELEEVGTVIPRSLRLCQSDAPTIVSRILGVRRELEISGYIQKKSVTPRRAWPTDDFCSYVGPLCQALSFNRRSMSEDDVPSMCHVSHI